MTKVRRLLLRHKSYSGAIGFDKLFKKVNWDFDWKAGQLIEVDYDAKTDTVTIQRIKK